MKPEEAAGLSGRGRAAEEAVRDAWDFRPVRTGPVCDEMNHNSVGSEVFCELDLDHDRTTTPATA